MVKNVILQGGTARCPICGNVTQWSCKLDTITSPEFTALNKMPTAFDATPSYRHVSYIMTADGQVHFVIGCDRCGAPIETEVMPLIDENNYRQNKRNI